MLISRPVVRSFKAAFAREAASWVRRGGHAIVWLSPRKARLVFSRPKDGDAEDLGTWSALDLGRSEYTVVTSGALAGLASLPVPHDCYRIVRERIVRDSVHAGPRRKLDLDCLACGACCKDNRVELDESDIERVERGGRPELSRPPYARREGGKVILVLRRDKRCKHLAGDNRCGIYGLRPDACSQFPVGSECCLSSREEELGIVDGAMA